MRTMLQFNTLSWKTQLNVYSKKIGIDNYYYLVYEITFNITVVMGYYII